MPPPVASKPRVAPVAVRAAIRSAMKVSELEFTTCSAPRLPEEFLVLHPAHDVDQGHAVLDADLLQHLAEVRGGGGVNQRAVTLEPHRLDHAQGGQRVDEAGCAFRRRRALWQHEAPLRFGQPVLRVHRATQDGHGAADQVLRAGRGTGGDDDPGALVAGRNRLTEASGHQASKSVGDVGGHGRTVVAFDGSHRGDVGGPQQHAEVGRVDRRCPDPDDDLVGPWVGHPHAGECELDRAAAAVVGADRGVEREAVGGEFGHRCSSWLVKVVLVGRSRRAVRLSR